LNLLLFIHTPANTSVLSDFRQSYLSYVASCAPFSHSPIRQVTPCKISHVFLPILPKTGSLCKITSEITGYFA